MSRDLERNRSAVKTGKPLAMLIIPPVYDFAFYDLYFKPYGLLRIGRWLEKGGWECCFVNALDYSDKLSLSRLKPPRRHSNGTGKMFRQPVLMPDGNFPSARRFSRYGIIEESFISGITSDRRPDIILISTFMTYWYKGVVETVDICKKIWPGVPVFTGGIYATLMPEHCRASSGADHVVKGAGWDYLNNYFLRSGLPVCCDGTGADPDEGDYLMESSVWKDAAVLRLNTGCPMKCAYCASSIIAEFSEGSPDAVFNQFLAIHKKYGTVNFAFYDDALLFKKDKILLPFLEKVTASRIKAKFYLPNAVHIDFLDSESVNLMRRAGFQEIRLGFESSDPQFHNNNGRKYDKDAFPAVIEKLKKNGFSGKNEIIIYILAGLPGQYADEVLNTVRYLSSFNVRISVSEYSPVPGSALWDESVKKSRYPIEENPLFHNNSIFPMEWEGFTYEDMQRVKTLASGFSV
ncbi:MAG: B12-binding domain-containing radical SAM protein [Spirochaetia bacterium]|jgi:hypothetical protein|nr:B12-binding domain-containing radical SAM protein [Spirochaetia bacterium]